MKFLVIGASGMVGHAVGLWLYEHGHEVVGFSRNKNGLFPCIAGDARDEEALFHVIEAGCFDTVVNCAALLVTASNEHPSEAVWINSYFPHKLYDYCLSTGAYLIHVSTDGVFRGDSGPYPDYALCDETGHYGRTKALGEVADRGAFTIRTCPVGPDAREMGSGLLDWFILRVSRGLPISGWPRAMWTGVTSIELARIIEESSKSRIDGIAQVVPDDGLSKLELLELFATYVLCKDIDISTDPSVIIDRRLIPSDISLCHDVRSYESQMRELREWIVAHIDIYPKRYRQSISIG